MPGLDHSTAAREGYDVGDLQRVFGESEGKIRGWLRRGLLVIVRGSELVSGQAVARFASRHLHEYDLRRVDQFWFKSMLFGEPAGPGGGSKRGDSR
jgi:hypothetical protein